MFSGFRGPFGTFWWKLTWWSKGNLSSFASYIHYSLARKHYLTRLLQRTLCRAIHKDSSETAADTEADGQTNRSNTYFEVAELHFKDFKAKGEFACSGTGEMRIWMAWTYMILQVLNINSVPELCECIMMYLPPVQTIQSDMIHSNASEIFNYILLNRSIFVLHQNLQREKGGQSCGKKMFNNTGQGKRIKRPLKVYTLITLTNQCFILIQYLS